MIGATHQVETIGVGELFRVAVRRAQQQDKQLLWPNPPVRQFYLFRNAAERHLDGSFVAQQLLYGGGNGLGILAETSKLFWMLQQSYDGVRN